MTLELPTEVAPSSRGAASTRRSPPGAIGDPLAPELPRLRWRVARDPVDWGRLEGDWNRLAAPGTPLADATWARRFIDAFPGRGRTPMVHAVYNGDQLITALALERVGRASRGWVSLDNEHSPYWTFPAAAASPALAEAMLHHLLSDADYIFFRRFHKDSAICRLLVEAADRARLERALIQSACGDATIPLVRPWSALRRTLSENLVTDTARKLRKLQRLGRLEHDVVTERGALDAALTECLDLETRGWKGVSGAPIRSRPDTHRFYTTLAHDLHARGRFALWVLRLNGRIIAFEYWLRGGGHIEMLKLSFDPEHAKQSPGNVLRYLALEHEIEHGDARVYHLGQSSEWKLRWATAVEPLCTLRVYAPTLRGRASYLAGPALRAALKKSDLARAAHAALARVRTRASRERA